MIISESLIPGYLDEGSKTTNHNPYTMPRKFLGIVSQGWDESTCTLVPWDKGLGIRQEMSVWVGSPKSVGQDPSDSKSNRLHVDIFRFHFRSVEVYSPCSSKMVGNSLEALKFNQKTKKNSSPFWGGGGVNRVSVCRISLAIPHKFNHLFLKLNWFIYN